MVIVNYRNKKNAKFISMYIKELWKAQSMT